MTKTKFPNLKLPVLVILLLACTDDVKSPSNKKCYLVKEVRVFSDNPYSWVIDYKYENDRLVKAGPDTIIYDSKNAIISVGNFNKYKYNSIGQLIYKWKYALWTYYDYFTYNQFGQVVKVKFEIDKGPEYSPSHSEGEYSYLYAVTNDFNPISGYNGVTYQYDDKKRPLDDIHPLIFGNHPAINNTLYTYNPSDSSAITTEYYYNEWGYPTLAVTRESRHLDGGIIPGRTFTISYDYDCH